MQGRPALALGQAARTSQPTQHTLLFDCFLRRGYPINYLPFVADKVEEKLEAATCESLIIERSSLLAGASRVPQGTIKRSTSGWTRQRSALAAEFEFLSNHCSCYNCAADMRFTYQCAALTQPLVQRKQLKMAVNSWVLHSLPANSSWDPASDSMLQMHEWNKHSALQYNEAIPPYVQQVGCLAYSLAAAAAAAFG